MTNSRDGFDMRNIRFTQPEMEMLPQELGKIRRRDQNGAELHKNANEDDQAKHNSSPITFLLQDIFYAWKKANDP